MHKIIYAVWGYNEQHVEFFLVLKETARSIVAERVESIEVNGDLVFPDLCKLTGEKFRVLKRSRNDGHVALISSFGHRDVVNAFAYAGEGVRVYNN